VQAGAARPIAGGVPRGAAAAAAAAGLAAGAYAFSPVDPTLLVVGAIAMAGAALIVLRVEWALPVVGVFAVLRLANVATETHGAPSLFQPLLALVAFGVLVRWMHTGASPAGGGRAIALTAGFLVVAAASTFFAAHPVPAFGEFEALAKDVVVAVLAGVLLQTATDLRRLVWSVVAAGTLLATLSAYQFLTGSFDQSFFGFARASVQNIVDTTDDVRVSGPIGDPNYYAQVLLMLIPLAVDRMVTERRRFLKVAAGYGALVMTAAVVFTFSRGGALALAVVAALLIWRYRPPAAALAAVAVAGVLAVPFLPSGYVERLTTLGQVGTVESTTDVSIRSRTAELRAGTGMLLDHPLTGVGYGTFAANYVDYTRSFGIEQRLKDREAHNLYLEVGAETGLLGIGAFGVLMIGSFVALGAARRRFADAGRADIADTAYAFTVALSAYYVTSIFLHMDFARTFWLITGVAVAMPSLASRVAARAEEAPAWP